jgi:arginine deiminase
MASQISNSFTTYKLSVEEELNGQVLNLSQKMVLQNELANISENLLNLVFDPLNPTKFAQDHAFLSGQRTVINYMLDRAQSAEAELKNLAQQSAKNQS